jgi:hypothetical protein
MLAFSTSRATTLQIADFGLRIDRGRGTGGRTRIQEGESESGALPKQEKRQNYPGAQTLKALIFDPKSYGMPIVT